MGEVLFGEYAVASILKINMKKLLEKTSKTVDMASTDAICRQSRDLIAQLENEFGLQTSMVERYEKKQTELSIELVKYCRTIRKKNETVIVRTIGRYIVITVERLDEQTPSIKLNYFPDIENPIL